MKKIIIIIVILLAVGAGYFLLRHNQAKAPTTETSQNQPPQSTGNDQPTQPTVTPSGQTQTINNAGKPDYTPSSSPTGGEVAPPNIQVVEVDYDGTRFTPAVVNIKVNDWVFFKNKSTLDFWPASNPHPTHTDYPGFDALKNIAPGGEYKFQFTKAGSWGYHNHLNPDIGGTVNVSK